MYLPPHFRAESKELVREVIENNPFATLVTVSSRGLQITHLPILFDSEAGESGTVRAHVARANPHWQFFSQEVESVVVVLGPHAYVSSTWYNPDTHVSTWNYAAVHLYGRPLVLDRADSLKFLEDLFVAFEHEESVRDMAPVRQEMERLIDGIVAFELKVERVEAKFKMSQNRKEGDRLSVIEHLRTSGADDVAAFMQKLGGDSLPAGPTA